MNPTDRPSQQLAGPSDPYAGLPDDHLLAPAPSIVNEDGAALPLDTWLRHYSRRDGIWQEVVSEMYRRAAGVPMVADYFGGVDMDRLQRHFLAAFVVVAGRGLAVGTVRRMATAHRHVRNSAGRPITGEAYDAVVATLAGLLTEHGVPPATVQQVGAVVAPLRVVIAVDQTPTATGATS